jgi:hypothetical protein
MKPLNPSALLESSPSIHLSHKCVIAQISSFSLTELPDEILAHPTSPSFQSADLKDIRHDTYAFSEEVNITSIQVFSLETQKNVSGFLAIVVFALLPFVI